MNAPAPKKMSSEMEHEKWLQVAKNPTTPVFVTGKRFCILNPTLLELERPVDVWLTQCCNSVHESNPHRETARHKSPKHVPPPRKRYMLSIPPCDIVKATQCGAVYDFISGTYFCYESNALNCKMWMKALDKAAFYANMYDVDDNQTVLDSFCA